jgi:hypothetical protein
MAAVSSVVATGRRMNGEERLIAQSAGTASGPDSIARRFEKRCASLSKKM